MLVRVESGEASLFTSRALLEELDRGMGCPKLRSILGKAGLAHQDILRWMVRYATIVMPKPLAETVIRADPSDDNILACAVSASADAVISGDKHVLDLRVFCGISIMTATVFIQKVRG